MKEAQPLGIADYLAAAAGIPHPWRATHYRIDAVAAMVHLWITTQPRPDAAKPKRSWFDFGKTPPAAPAPVLGADLQWRHLNCMQFTCQVHTRDVLEPHYFDLPWLGQPGLPFSNRLSRQVFTCLAEGMDIAAICGMLNIAFADLWKFKHALDQGDVKFEHLPTKKTDPPTTTGNLPDVHDPVWEQLITGQLDLDIRTLSLQLILSKLRQQVSLQQSDEVKQLKLRELHRYMERNQRSLTHELNQLNQLTQASHQPSQSQAALS